jgi:FKBP-type peptidyl-prolyl cis-trans isomerase (trigger factor)
MDDPPMQVNELAHEGLKRAYSVTLPASDIAQSREKRLAEIAKTVSLPGFRPGKVPLSVVRQRYGTAVMGEVLEESVNDAQRKLVTDRGLKPALQPKIEVTNFAEGTDLEFRMELEVLPDVPMPEFSGIELERLRAEPSDEEVQKILETLATRNGELTDVTEARPATKGEVMVCDFAGSVVPDLLTNGPALGAVPGIPGQAPRGWEIGLSGGLKSEIAAIGTDEALPYSDLRVSGTATESGWVQVFLEGAKGIAAAPGATQSLMVSTKLAGGTLPEGTQGKLGFNFYSPRADGVDFLDMQREAFDVTAGRSTLAFTFPNQAEIGACRPFIYLHGMPAGAAVEFTLRIGPARLIAGTEEPALAPFAGGSATDMPIEVGGPGFIPGFTEQMEGMSAGDSRDIQVVFPLEYGSAELAGKRAVFSITGKKLQQRVPRAIDDELAKTVGQENLAALQAQVKEGLQREYDAMARMRLKRALLDKLADQASFPVPEGMVEGEFSQIWQRVEADLKAGRLDSDDAGKDEATLRDEYRGIAQRRIRLGLLLSEIGRSNNIQVTPDELSRALRQEAARYRGQEQQVIEFFRKNPEAMENLRAPIFEEKVVDFILELAKVAERQVKPEELPEA